MKRLRKTLSRWFNFLRHPDRYALIGFRLMPIVSGGLPVAIDNFTARQQFVDRDTTALDTLSNHTISLVLNDVDTALTVGAAGGGAALPATPNGYVFVAVGNNVVKIPFYNP